jgi:hypothetical protein
LFLLLTLLLLSGGAFAFERVPPVGGLPQGYHGQSDQIQYNPMANQFQRTQPGDRLQYNPHENRFDYRQPGYQPQFNPFTRRWE